MRGLGLLLAMLVVAHGAFAQEAPSAWLGEWPATDFSRTLVDFDEILSGGPPKDGIPSIDDPRFIDVADVDDLAPTEPVIGLVIGGDARAYPLRVLTWHEIVNDEVGGVPVAITYCPLCNAAIVFERTVGDRVLDFGTTGKLRKSDLVMYDRQTQSWWQQFEGTAIVGAMAGTELVTRPTRLESFERFATSHPDGLVLVPNDPSARAYGRNPYAGYDGAEFPFLYDGPLPEGIPAMARVVAVGDEAWSLESLRTKGSITAGDLVLTWQAGQSSALDSARIADGRDVGNVVVQRQGIDIVYDVTFAFVFNAFRPNGTLHVD
ncbi:MAG: DUF3179 domain-containing protein [Alphaproteobacteria bacterium]